MFFVGATGQLITLMLTVGLPFVFLFSGNGNVELAQQTLRIEAHSVHSEIISVDVAYYCADQSNIIEVENVPLIFRECLAKCLLHKDFTEKWKAIYSKSSGNKAPPLIPCFIC